MLIELRRHFLTVYVALPPDHNGGVWLHQIEPFLYRLEETEVVDLSLG